MNGALAGKDPVWVAGMVLMAVNALVAAVVLALKPRPWVRYLCAITGHVNAVVAMLGVACGTSGLIDQLQGKLDLVPYVKVYLVLLGQLALLRILSYYRLRDQSALWWPR